MNKRKPDDEFAHIDLSFFKSSGDEVVVFCPESKDAAATQQPAMRRLAKIAETESPVQIPGKPDTEQSKISAEVADALELTKRHISILYGDTGYSYESIMTPYLRGAKGIVIEDPYIRLPHQIHKLCAVLRDRAQGRDYQEN
jgi:ATP-dependent Lon protease